MEPDLRTTLTSARGLVVTLSRYAPRLRQAPHRDRHCRITLVLRGGFQEQAPAGDVELGPGGLLMKSSSVRHENVFGGDGAALLSIELDEAGSGERLAELAPGCWRGRMDAQAIRLGVMLIESALARDAASVDVACADLVATDAGEDACKAPPAWLARLREEIEAAGLAQVDVAARAKTAGVHPAHASRLFRRCFGTSITGHAQAHGVRRAIALMSRPGARLADVALAAGFYDQSHMNRAFRRVSGRAPGAYRALVDQMAALAG